jgi:preprotein translocase subunit SecF
MIKQPWLLAVSGVCLLVVLWLVADRTMFLWSAEETIGTVVELSGRNERCGRRRTRHSCTKFSAQVQYASQRGSTHTLQISAGSARGHNQPVSRARVRKDGPVSVVYAPDQPTRAYENTLFGVWGAPLWAGLAQIATFLGSLTEGRKRRWS